MEWIKLYLISINLIGFIVMYMDKRRAKKRMWRIPEKTLFLIACIGGSIGGILGMRLFRHKTKHISFQYGFGAILMIQIIVMYGIIFSK